MSKKVSILGLVIVFLATIFVGCKKGENDPTLSLLSRTARITGVWNLKSSTITNSYSSGSTTQSFTDETGIMTVNYNYTVPITKNYTYSSTMTINKDNTFTMVEVEDETTTTTEGYWFFAPKNKDLDLKNKEAVIFQITKETYTDGDDTSYNEYLGTTNSHTYILQLDELSNKQITILYNYIQKDEDGLDSSTTGNSVYVQK